jgi:hypothetical protein
MRRLSRFSSVTFAGSTVWLFAGPVFAQAPLGPFSWQLQPYCNIVVVTATPDGPGYRLVGFDDQCGAARRAPVVGMATVSPDGSIAFAIATVTGDGRASHTAATLTLATLGGPWTDSAGNAGTFVFGVAGPATGPPRPAPVVPAMAIAPGAVTTTTIADATIGAVDVDPTAIQLRLQGTCPTGLMMAGAGADGALACGDGAPVATNTTALGEGALAISVGTGNTAVGSFALSKNEGSFESTAVGAGAMSSSFGSLNTAVGAQALSRVTGEFNVAVGHGAARFLGFNSHNNLHLGNACAGSTTCLDSTVVESDTIRIGETQTSKNFGYRPHTRAFIAGIFKTAITGGHAVSIDDAGQLGVLPSSRRYKQDIRDMGDASLGLLRLRPVTFRYIEQASRGATGAEYGLVAEEVAEIYPDLVVSGRDGQVEAVRYDKVTPMLLNELQRQQREIDAQRQRLQALEARLAELEGRFRIQN